MPTGSKLKRYLYTSVDSQFACLKFLGNKTEDKNEDLSNYPLIFMPKSGKKQNPPMFQGSLNLKQYFEGWYFKLVDASETYKYAIIPGISLDKKKGTSHAFIQLLQGATGQVNYFTYPLEQFWASDKDFEVKIGKSTFATDHVELDMDQDGHTVNGSLQFKDIIHWPHYRFAPGIMGWYQFMPFMECYHGLVSLNHSIEGQLTIAGEDIDFTGGLGYIEKDYGRSFPSSYIWIQSNHFSEGPASFFASIARVPWLGRQFPGFLAIFWYKGNIYRLTTYAKAKIQKLEISPNQVNAEIADKHYLVEFQATKHAWDTTPMSEAGELKAPVAGAMQNRINESLLSEVHVRLYEQAKKGSGKKLIFDGTGRNAGVEIEATTESLKV